MWIKLGITCHCTAADQVCEGDKEARGAPEVGVQQDSGPLAQLVQQPGVRLVHQAFLRQLQQRLRSLKEIKNKMTSRQETRPLTTHLQRSEDSEALKRLMGSVRGPSSPVTVSDRSCNLREMKNSR